MAMELRCTITEAHEEAILAITLNVLRDELYSAGIKLSVITVSFDCCGGLALL